MKYKYQSELIKIIADKAIEEVQTECMKRPIWNDAFGKASEMTDKELEAHCLKHNIDIEVYINTGEDI